MPELFTANITVEQLTAKRKRLKGSLHPFYFHNTANQEID
jgi:hypothetical protein